MQKVKQSRIKKKYAVWQEKQCELSENCREKCVSGKKLKLVKDEDIVSVDKMAAIIKWRKFSKLVSYV